MLQCVPLCDIKIKKLTVQTWEESNEDISEKLQLGKQVDHIELITAY